MRVAAAIAIAGSIGWLVPPAHAQDEPDAVVSTTVIVDNSLARDEVTPAKASGLTLDAVTESEARKIRKDAADNLDRGQFPAATASQQPDVTVVSVEQVAISRPENADSEACVQVGVVAARRGCRPPKH